MSIRPVISEHPLHPALAAHRQKRAESIQNRLADTITRFAGSMAFVYVHVVWFTAWIGLRVEKYPYGLLTMVVSLEAIFLSTFILISSNRQDERREMLANSQWQLVQQQEKQNELEISQNERLLTLSNQILELTRAVHDLAVPGGGHAPPT